MAKTLKNILTGVKSSKTVKPDLKDLAMSPEGNKGELEFAAKHEIEKHADRAGNDEKVYSGGTSKTTKYKFQKDGVYESEEISEEDLDEKYMGFSKLKKSLAAKGAKKPGALAAWIGRKKYGKSKFQAAAAKGKKLGEAAMCNHTNEGVMCELHGESACPSGSDNEPRYKGKKVLMDKKIKESAEIEEGSWSSSRISHPRPMYNRPGTGFTPGEAEKAAAKIKSLRMGQKKGESDDEYDARIARNTAKQKGMSEGRVEDVAHKKMTRELAALAAASNKPVTKLKPGKKQYNQLKSTGAMFGGARTMAAGLAKRDIEAAGGRGSSVAKAIVKEEDIEEAGGFSYGAKKPRKGSLKDLINKQSKKYQDKQPVIEPKDQMVGTAKVVKEDEINEVAPPNPKIEKWIKANKERFVKEYGKEKGTQVLYAKAWKMHGQSESGTATNTDYTGPGAAGWTTGRLDVGTL